MKKIHDLKTTYFDGLAINYFYKRENNDVNGNPRFRVYVIDPEGPAVYEFIAKTYEGLLPDRVKTFFEKEGHTA